MQLSEYSLQNLEELELDIKKEIENRKKGIKLRNSYFVPDIVYETSRQQLKNLKISENLDYKILIGEVEISPKNGFYIQISLTKERDEWILEKVTGLFEKYLKYIPKPPEVKRLYLSNEDLKFYIELVLRK